MKNKNLSRIILWAGIVLLIGLLIAGCAQKPEPVVEPPGPTPEELEQARQDSIQAAEEAMLAAQQAAAKKAAMEAEQALLAAEQAAKSSLQVIFFDFDRYNLRSDARTAADFDAGVLSKYGDWQVLIEGHCDERGTDEYNLALGERRANTVKDFFINYGLDAPRFTTVSYGEERPATMGHGEDAWSQNRRAVLVIR
ncbi:peptidoglycan-associated lipoprotein [candidate division LCP-89 bacterium B3_LCP]|uniref:Peptidoglycan-associated lipoprotein n=1 Tax=candidate division LCP-89 bacterium B3_LCP TaxID=2012998 RepID=A0A532V599_UNCL8|nr:MAG: peptidoglycan-associated lipoprotein [candidate division LCP-89 bacterium B3_LCP]